MTAEDQTETASDYQELLKRNVRRAFEEIFDRGNVDVVDEVFAPGVVFHSTSRPDGPTRGREEYKEFARGFLEAFSDVRTTMHDIIVEGNLLCVRATVHARQRGWYQGIPPTGRPFTVREMIMVRASPEGLCEEAWSMFDTMSMGRQLGVVPRKPPPKPVAWLMVRLQRPSNEHADD